MFLIRIAHNEERIVVKIKQNPHYFLGLKNQILCFPFFKLMNLKNVSSLGYNHEHVGERSKLMILSKSNERNRFPEIKF